VAGVRDASFRCACVCNVSVSLRITLNILLFFALINFMNTDYSSGMSNSPYFILTTWSLDNNVTSYETNYIKSKRRIENPVGNSGSNLQCRAIGIQGSCGDVCSIVVGKETGDAGVWIGSAYVE
jgi:hypothetical protein